MIRGMVTADGDPVVEWELAGQTWQAVIDTGFNGDLELPSQLKPHLSARFRAKVHSLLAGGQSIMEDEYTVFVPFDGETCEAGATFVPGDTILIGTSMLRRHYLGIDFVAQTVLLERVV